MPGTPCCEEVSKWMGWDGPFCSFGRPNSRPPKRSGSSGLFSRSSSHFEASDVEDDVHLPSRKAEETKVLSSRLTHAQLTRLRHLHLGSLGKRPTCNLNMDLWKTIFLYQGVKHETSKLKDSLKTCYLEKLAHHKDHPCPLVVEGGYVSWHLD